MASEDNALMLIQSSQIIGIKVLLYPFLGVFFRYIFVTSEHNNKIIAFCTVEVACVFDCLPMNVGAGVVPLQFDDHETPVRVYGQ